MSNDYRNNSMLDDANKRVSEARGALSAMFRTILLKRNIDPYMWSRFMDGYLDDPANGVNNNSRDRSSARGNLNKELHGPAMTWRVFRKGIDFIRPDIADMTMRLQWPDGEATEVTLRLRDDPKREVIPQRFFEENPNEQYEEEEPRLPPVAPMTDARIPLRTLNDIRSARPHIRRYVNLQPLMEMDYNPQAPHYRGFENTLLGYDTTNYDFRIARQGIAEYNDEDGWLATTYSDTPGHSGTDLTLRDQIAIENEWHRVGV